MEEWLKKSDLNSKNFFSTKILFIFHFFLYAASCIEKILMHMLFQAFKILRQNCMGNNLDENSFLIKVSCVILVSGLNNFVICRKTRLFCMFCMAVRLLDFLSNKTFSEEVIFPIYDDILFPLTLLKLYFSCIIYER